MLIVRTVLILVFAVLCASCINGDGALPVTGQIEAESVAAGTRTGGRVEEVFVEEGDRVAKGATLVQLESSEAQAAVDGAAANLAQCRAMYEKLEKGARPEQIRQAEAAAAGAEANYLMALEGARSQEIEAARANVESARAMRDEAASSLNRAEQLLKDQAISQQRYDQAKHNFDALENQLKAAMEQLDLITEGTRDEQIAAAKAQYDQAAAALEEIRNGARPEDLAAAKSRCDAAEAELKRAKTMARETVILAPMDGVVESADVHPGDLVQPGPVVTVVNPEDLEMIVYVSALKLGDLAVGQPLYFTTDAHGAERFSGRITYIAPRGEFTPRNLQTQEERVEQVFGVRIEHDSHGGKLRAGMTATVYFDKAAAGDS